MDIDKLAKPFLKDIIPYKPGKPIEQLQRERGVNLPVSKLASNENPYPPHEKIEQAVLSALRSSNRYPESGSPELTKKIAELHGVSGDEVFVGNGTNEILELLIRAYVGENEKVVFSELSFAIYRIVCAQCGVDSIEVPCRDYTHDLAAMAKAIDANTKIALVCNPNNPTGTYNTREELTRFMSETPDHTLLVMDEAYHEFARADDYPDALTFRNDKETVVVLRTFSKYFSLAGIRVGYAIAHKSVIETLHKVRQPFNVNRLAQAAAIAAIDCRDELEWFVEETIRERDAMRGDILELGCVCPPSQTNFLFVVPEGYSGDMCKTLEEEGIIVRPMAPFGAPHNSFRVNTGTPEENRRFLNAFKSTLSANR